MNSSIDEIMNPAPKPTAAQLSAAIQIAKTIHEAIAAAGPKGIPNGHLYAAVMGSLSFDSYQSCLGLLKRSGLVEESDNVLRAVRA